MSDFLKHCFLIATPNIEDPAFEQSVVYLYEHDEEGAMGLVINKPLNIQLDKIFEHLEIDIKSSKASHQEVMMGGPIGQDNGFIIHPQSLATLGSKDPLDEVAISASKQTLCDIATGKGPEDFMVTLGYSGWEPGQLIDELAENAWIVAPFQPGIIFNTPIDKRYQRAADLAGINMANYSGQVGHA